MLFRKSVLGKGVKTMELKKMSDQELAQRMVDYIERLDQLAHEISNYIECKAADAEYIKREYRALKQAIRQDSDYVSKQRNKDGSELYIYYFSPYMKEADAEGCTVPVNARIDFNMFSAVRTAHYKLTKCWSLEEWKQAAQ